MIDDAPNEGTDGARGGASATYPGGPSETAPNTGGGHRPIAAGGEWAAGEGGSPYASDGYAGDSPTGSLGGHGGHNCESPRPVEIRVVCPDRTFFFGDFEGDPCPAAEQLSGGGAGGSGGEGFVGYGYAGGYGDPGSGGMGGGPFCPAHAFTHGTEYVDDPSPGFWNSRVRGTCLVGGECCAWIQRVGCFEGE